MTYSFYAEENEEALNRLGSWFEKWRLLICENPPESNASNPTSRQKLSERMKLVNPKYTLREWLLVPAYQQANEGSFKELKMLQQVMTNPYGEQSEEIEKKYYRKKPAGLFNVAGVSHVSCSS